MDPASLSSAEDSSTETEVTLAPGAVEKVQNKQVPDTVQEEEEEMQTTSSNGVVRGEVQSREAADTILVENFQTTEVSNEDLSEEVQRDGSAVQMEVRVAGDGAGERVIYEEALNNGFVEIVPAPGFLEKDRQIGKVEEKRVNGLILQGEESSGPFAGAPGIDLILEVPNNGSLAEAPSANREVRTSGRLAEEPNVEWQLSDGQPMQSFDSSVLLSVWDKRKAGGPVLPIADMRGVDSLNYTKSEKQLRFKLAAACRLVDLFGWSDGISAGLSAVTNSGEILTAPVGILHDEVTASSLVRVDLNDGAITDSGSTCLGVSADHIALHAAVYRQRDDAKCVMHFTSPAAVSFSALKSGLLPLCPEAMELGEITYSDYPGGAIGSQDDEASYGLALKPPSKVMFLRNFGLVVCGDSVEQTFNLAHSSMVAIEVQMKLMHLGLGNLYLPSKEKQRDVFEASTETPPLGVQSKQEKRSEEIKFEGLMRMLDGAGYQTGYIYQSHLGSNRRPLRSLSLMNVAPSARISELGQREPNRSITPTAGAPGEVSPRPSETPGRCRSVIENRSLSPTSVSPSTNSIGRPNSHRFIPLGTDVREFKRKVNEIRKMYVKGGVSSAGPQSTVLEGMTWEEARRFQENRGSGQQGVAKVTAASRGIIQRDHQKSAVFLKGTTAVNPFDVSFQRDLDDYVLDVGRKAATTTTTTQSELNGVDLQQTATKETNPKTYVPCSSLTRNIAAETESSVGGTEVGRVGGGGGGERMPSEASPAPMSSKPPETDPVRTNFEDKERLSSLGSREMNGDSREPVRVEESPPQAAEQRSGTSQTLTDDSAKTSQLRNEPVALQGEVPKRSQPETSSELHDAALSSKAAKLQKSKSVMEENERKSEVASPVDDQTHGGDSAQSSSKDKRKKRGLSAFFSKKKDI